MRVIIAAAGMTVALLIGVGLAANGSRVPVPGSPTASFNHTNVAATDDAQSDKMWREVMTPILRHDAFATGREQAAGQSGQMAEDVFKNVQVLKGIPVDEFMGTMGVFSAALTLCCSECHTGAGTQSVDWVVDTPRKRTARRMVTMMNAINRDSFGGRQVVTCWTCHRGAVSPMVTPTMDTVYAVDPVVQRKDILPAFPGAPAADEILDKYIKALGGAERLARFTSYVAKGSNVGMGRRDAGDPVEIDAKAPDQRATFIDANVGRLTRIFDGRAGSVSTPLTVVKEYPLTGGELEGARLDAKMSFPGQIKQFLTNWRVNIPDNIGDRIVDVVQGTGANGLVATFYFDKQTGLLLRMVRYTNSPVGRVPTQVDFADYREVPGTGVKMPYRWNFAWLDGRDIFELRDVQPNVPIDPAKFQTAVRVQ
jgi:hypothetical protein